MNNGALECYVNQLLGSEQYRDYAPNGLQVEGRSEIHHIVTGVTASLALLEQALALEADAVLVHHGYFWKSEDPRIIGPKKRRLALLLGHDINLFAWHLPLDGHSELGNNACLAALMNWIPEGQAGDQALIWYGRPASPLSLDALGQDIEHRLARPPLVLGDPHKRVERIAWCSGAAQSYLQSAIDLGVDVYVTGEVSEPVVHLARESGVAFIAAGHHATERYGIKALGDHLAQQFGLRHTFVDVPSPV